MSSDSPLLVSYKSSLKKNKNKIKNLCSFLGIEQRCDEMDGIFKISMGYEFCYFEKAMEYENALEYCEEFGLRLVSPQTSSHANAITNVKHIF